MSIKLMTAIFELDLLPGPKLLLLALGDNCNDYGYGFPSISLLARKASISQRTGMRYLQALEKRQLLHKTPRRTVHGRQTSNAYQLNLDALYEKRRSDNLSVGSATTGGSTSPRTFGGDTGGIQTTIKPPNKPPRASAVVAAKKTYLEGSELLATIRDGFDDAAMNSDGYFAFPLHWRSDFIRAIQQLVVGVAPTDAQVLIDELSVRMSDGDVKHPLSYLRALIKSHRAGNFIPERAHRNAAKREEKEAALADPPGRAAIAREVMEAINKFKSSRKFK
jgi:hypothetical protein